MEYYAIPNRVTSYSVFYSRGSIIPFDLIATSAAGGAADFILRVRSASSNVIVVDEKYSLISYQHHVYCQNVVPLCSLSNPKRHAVSLV